MHQRNELPVVNRVIEWSEGQEAIRLVILTSNRAINRIGNDAFSDYDIVLVVSELAPFAENPRWLHELGEPLVTFEQNWQENGVHGYTCLVIFEDGTKIDFQVWLVAFFQMIKQASPLPVNLDVGYRVLLDKDGLAEDLPPFTNTAHIPSKPTEQEYIALVREFWWETSYVAKNLWRDELLPARYNLDAVIKFDLLRRMLEWSIEIDHDWSLRPGAIGKGLKKRLPPELWNELAETFVGPELDENWAALFQTTALFGKVARRLADHLGYTYPEELEEKVTAYLRKVQRLDRDAETFA
jgi:aminoglycoside 6-adenylyltransferase